MKRTGPAMSILMAGLITGFACSPAYASHPPPEPVFGPPPPPAIPLSEAAQLPGEAPWPLVNAGLAVVLLFVVAAAAIIATRGLSHRVSSWLTPD